MTDTIPDVEDAAELDRRRRWYDGWLSESDVSLLIELGHLEEVTRRADRGDWFCAHGLATMHQLDGHHDVAIEMLWPFTQTGWWIATQTVASILADCGRTDEAIALCRPTVVSGDCVGIEYSARLLARAGRAGEAFDLLWPSVDDWFHAQALVEVSAGLGREGEVTQLLLEAIERLRPPLCDIEDLDVYHYVELLATVLERQGRVDEAVALLNENKSSSNITFSNIVEHLAAILIRHQRYDELRELLAGQRDAREIFHVVEQLPEGIDLDRMASAIRAIPDPETSHAALHPDAVLGQMLIRAGRTEEGIAGLRKALDPLDITSLQFFLTLLLDHGCPDEAMALIDECAVMTGGMTWELLVERGGLLRSCGRTMQAIEELRLHPEAGEPAGVAHLSDLLVSVGRLDEAIAVVEPSFRLGENVDMMARLILRQGRVEEGMRLLCRAKPEVFPVIWTQDQAAN